MRVRYIGPPGEVRLLAFPGGGIECPAGEWVDVLEALYEAHIGPEHAGIVIRGLAGSEIWEVDDLTERPAKGKTAAKQAAEQPAETGEEEA